MSSTNENELKKEKKTNIRWMLAVYDVLIFAIVSIILLVLYGGMDKLSPAGDTSAGMPVFCMYFRRTLYWKNLSQILAIWLESECYVQIVLYRC